MGTSLQQILDQHFDAFAATRTLHPRELRAAQSIRGCYTQALGSHVLRCPAGHFQQIQLHACRHRSCPRCAESARKRWIDAQLQRLLPCAHFHVIFTLPHKLLALWELNRAWFTRVLFDGARAALLELLADPRHLGAVPGLLMSLHTWGRTLSHHPHIHCLVSAGGVDASGRWKTTREGFLLPLKPLQQLFRGKLLAALRLRLQDSRHALVLPRWSSDSYWRGVVARLYRDHWNVQICPPYASGRGVVLYLARYAKGGPCPKTQHLVVRDAHVLTHYTDHRDAQLKPLRLAIDEFIARILWHAPAPRQHTTRHAGLYTSRHRLHHAQARAALDHAPPSPAPWPRPEAPPRGVAPTCPRCQLLLLRSQHTRGLRLSALGVHQDGEISLAKLTSPANSAASAGPTRRSTGPPLAPPRAPSELARAVAG